MSDEKFTFVVGASDNPERYSYKAIAAMIRHGHNVVGIHPKLKAVQDVRIFRTIADAVAAVGEPHTITMYLGEKLSTPLKAELLQSNPERVIFNPGAENPGLAAALTDAGVEVVEGCTLVMLSIGQF